LNRKEGVIIGLVLLVSFVGGVFAAPAIQQTLIVNDPLNVRIVGGSSTPQTSSVDIEVIKFAGVGVSQSGNAYTIPTDGVAVGNLTAAFSFAPAGFQQVNSLRGTIIYHAATFYGTCNPCYSDDRFNIQLNGQLVSDTAISVSTYPQAAVSTLGNLRFGSNLINIVATNPTAPSPGVYWVYEVRLTVEYTFIA